MSVVSKSNLTQKEKEELAEVYSKAYNNTKDSSDITEMADKCFEITLGYDENQVVGGTAVNYRLEEDTCELTQIAVHPEHQNQGIGSKMYEEALKSARHISEGPVFSYCTATNIGSQILALKNGLKPVGIKYNFDDSIPEEDDGPAVVMQDPNTTDLSNKELYTSNNSREQINSILNILNPEAQIKHSKPNTIGEIGVQLNKIKGNGTIAVLGTETRYNDEIENFGQENYIETSSTIDKILDSAVNNNENHTCIEVNMENRSGGRIVEELNQRGWNITGYMPDMRDTNSELEPITERSDIITMQKTPKNPELNLAPQTSELLQEIKLKP